MHPILFVITEIILSILVVGFTPPDSAIRKAALFPVVYCMIKCLPSCMEHMVRTPWASLLGGGSVTVLYHFVDIALISKWSFTEGRPVGSLIRPNVEKKLSSENQQIDSMGNRLRFGSSIATNYRFINTPYQIKNVPGVSTTDTKAFLWRKTSIIIVSYLLLDLINSSTDPAISLKFFTLERVHLFSRLPDVTAEEIVIRTLTVLVAGISLNCVQGGIYNLFALLYVSIGHSAPEDWPPFYGNPVAAYTLRRFWGVYWHQSNTRKYSSLAQYAVHTILMVPRGTTAARYLRVVVAFISSGIMHVLIDISAGIELKDSGAARFFVTQALGVLLETSVIAFYRSMCASKQGAGAIGKALGFIWVSAYLIWSTPSYLYPIMWRTNAGYNDSVIPYSFFDPEERGRAAICVVLVILFTHSAALLHSSAVPP